MMKNFTLISLILLLSVVLGFSGCSSKEEAPKKVSAKEVMPKAKAEVAAPVEEVTPIKIKRVASVKLVDVEKEGFLSTDKCAAAGEFKDCYLENYACGSDGCAKKTEPGVHVDVNIVLYSHKEMTIYNLDMSKIHTAEVDEAINRNDVTIIGKYNASTNTIIAHEIKAPPPPKKSFFKGCL